MPELPEVETVRRDLQRLAGGAIVESVAVTGMRTVRRYGSESLVDGLTGATIAGTRRHGKYLIVALGRAVWVVHLRMSGMLLWSAGADDAVRLHTHVRVRFTNGSELRFVDPRTFGEMWVTSADVPELAHIGPDAWNDIDSARALRERLVRSRSPLKVALVNQSLVAGIGNIYADEICWVARVRPERPANGLSRPAYVRVFEAMREVLGAAIAARGSSLADRQYVDLFGELGSAQLGHRVYAREGEPCPRCGSRVVRLPLGARSAFSCRRCQR